MEKYYGQVYSYFLRRSLLPWSRNLIVFLWGGNDTDHARAKVAWNSICVPKKGGLGLKKLEDWNKAAILRHIWNIFAQFGSLWVAWIKEHLLKGKSL